MVKAVLFEEEAPALNLYWLVDIFQREKFNGKYSEIKPAICIVTSNLTMLITILLLSIYHHHHHHHHVALVAWISLTLSRHSSLSFIALGRSSGQHPVSSHSWWMYVRAGRPAFARPCVGVHKSTSLMSSSLGHCWRSRDELEYKQCFNQSKYGLAFFV